MPATRPDLRRTHLFRTAVAAVLLTVLTIGAPAPASADEWSDADYMVALVNEARAWEGVAPVHADGHLQEVAAWWAGEMARGGFVAHNPYVWHQVYGWWALAENVGYGYSVDAIHNALVNSGYHWANMVNPEYDRVGVAVAYDGWGDMYIVQLFARF